MKIRKYLSQANAVKRALFSSSQRKHWLRLLASFRTGYTVEAAIPWIPFDAIDFLERRIKPASKIFEYGSGGSTLFWLKCDMSCVSIEHDHDWYLRMRTLLAGQSAVDLRLVRPEPGRIGAGDPSEPNDYASSDATGVGNNFRSYASQIDEFPDEWFDVVVVDGRARPSCVMHSVRKVRIGGLLLLDNSDRGYYLQKTAIMLQGFEARKFSGATPGLFAWSESTVFVKHSSGAVGT